MTANLEVTLLSDNVSRSSNLLAEHGLSMVLRSGDKSILFDTGASGQFVTNAATLGIDLATVDFLVLSHSHYDHTGGLKAFAQINPTAPILVKQGFFDLKYKGDRYIGPPELDVPPQRFEILSGPRELAPGLWIITEIPLQIPEDSHLEPFRILTHGILKPDTFEDEVFFLWKGQDYATVITACSHRGLANILLAAEEFAGVFPLQALGGFHLKDDSEEKKGVLARRWRSLGLERVLPCHCTGEASMVILSEVFKHHARFLTVGSKVVL